MKNFDEMHRLFREMDRMFDEFRTGWYGEPDRRALDGDVRADEGDVPVVEGSPSTTWESPWSYGNGSWFDRGSDAGSTLERIDDEYVFVMDLPGFEREDIDLRFDGGLLSVHAARDVDEDADGMHAFRSRRVERSVRIPAEVAVEECSASYHNGVLEVHLPVEAMGEGGNRIDID